MRKNKAAKPTNDFAILALDDDVMMTETLKSYFERSGYRVDMENDPLRAVERIREGSYDILLLDFLMSPICGDEVVSRIRQFNSSLYIILLTGHKSLAPPIKTIRELDIQGYYEKSDRFDQLELLIESCAKSIRQMRTIDGYRMGLSFIVDSLPAIYRIQTLDEFASAILAHMRERLPCGDGFVYIDAPSLAGDSHQKDRTDGFASLFSGIGRFAANREVGSRLFEEMCSAYSTASFSVTLRDGLMIFPLAGSGGRLSGIICADGTSISAQNGQLFEIFTGQASSALSNLLLRIVLNQRNTELERSYLEIISALRLVVDAKDIYTRGHSDRVSYFAERIAKAMGKPPKYTDRIRIAGLFHDVGKIGVSDEVLTKPTRLCEEEFAQIKTHPAKGEEILSAISLFADIAPIAGQHHERLDGTGYPKGLSGSEIIEEARIISIADAFDAMTSHRQSRDNLSFEQAVDELIRGKGTQFDPEITDVFLELLRTDYETMQSELAWTLANDLPH